jgi:hypothetical protein
MAEGIMIASDCADWWDKQLKEYHAELEVYVLENPGLFGVCVATAKASAADFAHAYFVDLARLGEGAAEGSVKGIVQDIFRVMNFIPPGKVLSGVKAVPKSLLGRAVQFIANSALWRRIGGGNCVPISIAQALQRSGQKFAVGLAEIAKAIGQPLEEIYEQGVKHWSSIGPALSKLGVEFTTLMPQQISKFEDLVRVAGSTDGPVLVRIFGKRIEVVKGVKKLVDAGHAILVGKTARGVKIIDRSGFYNSLDDLSRAYGMDAANFFRVDASQALYQFKNAVIDESTIHLVSRLGVLACLARVSLGIFDFNPQADPEMVKKKFEEFVASRRGTRIEAPDVVIVGGKSVPVTARGTPCATLSGISTREYGTWELWSLIYDLNKDKIGKNPNLLKVGTPLLVLPLERYTPVEIAAAKRRAPTWKNYPY